MTKWEYDYYKWNDIDKCILTDGGGFVVRKSLDEMGEKGWELVVIYNGEAYFKRIVTNTLTECEKRIEKLETDMNDFEQRYGLRTLIR